MGRKTLLTKDYLIGNYKEMKQLYCSILFILGLGMYCKAQQKQPSVRYDIQAKLDVQKKTIDGQWDALYTNRTDSTLHAIWLTLYPNAFASDKTNYSEDLLRWGNTKYYFGKEEDRGWIDSLNITIDGSNAVLDTKETHPEMLKLILPHPLPPGNTVHLSTTFFTQIPYNFENDGYRDFDFLLKAWCPLIADLNEKGWVLKPYSAFLNNETALAEYQISLQLPKNYILKSNGKEVSSNNYNYIGKNGFQWIASPNKNFLENHSMDNGNIDSVRTAVAKKIFPQVFHSGKVPQYPSIWLGQTYKNFHRPVPFLNDSFYYRKDSSLLDKSKSLKIGFLYDFRQTDQYKYLFASPAIGFNNYDKLMVGVLLHNYQLPQQPFSFAIAPMYATGSKRFAGWGQLGYNIWQERAHWNIGLGGSTFSRRDFDIPDYPKFYQRMWRVVPSIEVTLLDQNAASTRKLDIGLRSFIMSEQDYTSYVSPGDTSFGNVTSHTTLFRASAKLEDTRKLYPYSLSLMADAGKEFLRLGLTGKYFFNYDATNRGVSARLFAGKFFYLKSQTGNVQFYNRRYNLSLSAPSEIYDYTYSDYFIGRNESQGWMSQQVMERDGFFKIPTNSINGSLLGISDDWLTALNLTADIPKDYDPLRKIGGGLKLFFDIGTYSDLWSDVPPAGRFLYDAGVQISLFKSLVNVYVPILYSKVYKDQLPSQNRFWKTVSFNINLSAFSPRKQNALWPQ